MIKENAIRLGNWVRFDGQAIQADKDFMELMFCEGRFEFLEPIPLTPEILEAAGFVFDLITYYKGDFILAPCTGGFHFFFRRLSDGLIIKIISVHQLQNLYFTLTGEELLIKL